MASGEEEGGNALLFRPVERCCIPVQMFLPKHCGTCSSFYTFFLLSPMGNVVYRVQKTAGQCFSKWGPDGDIGTNGCRALPSPVLDVLALVLPLNFVLAVPTPYPQPWTYSCFSPAANVTVSLPVRGCVQDEFCTRDSATGPGFTLSGSCCQGSRCNSDLRNKTYFSPQFPPLVLLPPPRSTTLAPAKSVSTST